ncbi:hypothetical protein TWF281_002746 [Arthrobotrys megalospora]
MRAARIIQHTTQNVQRLHQPRSQLFSTLGISCRAGTWTRPRYPLINSSHVSSNFRRHRGMTASKFRGYTTDATDLEVKSSPSEGTGTSQVTREPTPPPRPNKHPKTLYEWEYPEPPDHGTSLSIWPKLNSTLVDEIEGKLQAATREAISLPDHQHQAHYKRAYEKIVESSDYDVPITDPPSESIAVVAVDELWSDQCRECPCFCEDDLPYILIRGPTENGGKGVTYKMLLEQMGDWLYGENAEEILEGERGKIGLTVLTYLVPGGEHEGNGLLYSKLYWYMRKAEVGVKIGW